MDIPSQSHSTTSRPNTIELSISHQGDQQTVPLPIYPASCATPGSMITHGDSESCRHSTTIDDLSDNVLLDIFDLYHRNIQPYAYNWYDIKDNALVYVCRRWRQIILKSPRRHGLLVRCTYGTPVKKNILISHWPNIPIGIDYCKTLVDTLPDDEENLIFALEHSDRVANLFLRTTDLLLGKLATLTQKPFPALTHLFITSVGQHTPILSAEFLGGSAPSLQFFSLLSISFPAFPTLLSSARDLVTFRLHKMPPRDYISPEMLVSYLAALPKLESFGIQFHSTTPYPDQIQPHPIARVVLPELIDFQMNGTGKYLEDFTARIDCPRLHSFDLVYFVELADCQVTQLVKFFERLGGPEKSPFYDGKVRLDTAGLSLYTYRPPGSGWDRRLARTVISRSPTSDWKAFPLFHMLRQFSPMISGVLYFQPISRFWLTILEDDPDDIDWPQILLQFSAVWALCISQPLAGDIARSLRYTSGEVIAEGMSSLDLVCLEKESAASCMNRFTAFRQLSGRPVTVAETVKEFDRELMRYLINKEREETPVL